MKKNLALRFTLLFALALSLQSCRTGEDYLSAKEEQYYSNKFQVFTSFNDEPIDYAKGFKTLMENYDGIHKTHYTRTSAIKSGSLGKSDEEYVEFRLHSQSMLLENSERWIIYAIVKNKQVSGLMAGILRNEETEVEFRKLDSGNDYYDEVLKIFSMAYLKHNLKNGLNNKGGGCGFDSDDACDIGNIDISPPKGGGPKGSGPKGGCTGFNNCINPNLGGGGGEGGGPGGTGSSYVEPCDKTKTMLDSQKNKDIIKDLRDHLTNGANAGEKGWRDNKTGAPTQATQNADHSVNLGNPSTMNGGYHNHPGTGVNIFSADDIAILIEIARYQAIGNAGNAYMVVIAPGGIHYVMYFNGTHNEIPAYGSYSTGQLDVWNKEQWKQNVDLISDNISINERLEQIFFSTLENMGLKNKIILQRVEEDSKILTINQNSNGAPAPAPCN